MAPVFDDYSTFPHIAWLRGAAAHGDWPAVAGFFQRLPDDDERSFHADALADVAGVEAMLAAAADRHPDLTLPRVLLARRLVTMAWEARTGRRAEHVRADQFAAMHAHLRRAERMLVDVTALEPGNAPAWACRVITARGLELGVGETRRRYARLAAADPHHFAGQTQLLQQLCPKWGGTWEDAHGFADACTRSGPPGGVQGGLVAIAHLERWLEADDDAYLRRPDVQRGLTDATAWSVLHPRFRPRAGAALAHGAFAMCFALAGVDQRAAPHLRWLGDAPTEWPWNYLADPGGSFETFRARALGPAVRR